MRCKKNNLILLIGISICNFQLVVPGYCLADSDSLPSVITVGLGTDSEQGQQQNISIDLRFLAQTRAYATFVNSDQPSVGNSNVDTKTYVLGLASNQHEAIKIGVEFEHWGQTDVLTTDTRRAKLEYDIYDLSLSISPEQQFINFYRLNGSKIEASSMGWGLGADLSVLDKTLFSVSFIEYEYSHDIEIIRAWAKQHPVFSALYLATRLELATGLEKRRKTVGISYQLSTADIGIDWVQSTSAFDGEKIKIISMYIDLAIDESWSVNFEMGKQSADEVDDVTFGYLSLSYYW